jgi:hypothetical protein
MSNTTTTTAGPIASPIAAAPTTAPTTAPPLQTPNSSNTNPPILMLKIVPTTTVKNTDGSGDIVTKYSVEVLAQNTTGLPIVNNDVNNYSKFRTTEELEKYKSDNEKNIQIIDSNCRDEKCSVVDTSLLVNPNKPLTNMETIKVAPVSFRNKLVDLIKTNPDGDLSKLDAIKKSNAAAEKQKTTTTTTGGKRKTNKKRKGSSYKKFARSKSRSRS